MNEREARERFAVAPVARLATVGADGRPHLVPVTFALLDDDDRDAIAIAVDHKPKRTLALKRLANIRANPAVTLLADHYEDEWSALWWVRADGDAEILEAEAEAEAEADAEAEPPAADALRGKSLNLDSRCSAEHRVRERALDALAAKYHQYRERRPAGPVIVVAVSRWSGWAATG